MSFFKKVKNAFSSGVKSSIDGPGSFSWRQETIPVSITFTGKADVESEIEKVTFTVRKPLGADETEKDVPKFVWEDTTAVSIPAGGTGTRHYEIPIPIGLISSGVGSNRVDLKESSDVELVTAIKVAGTVMTSNKHRRLRVVEIE